MIMTALVLDAENGNYRLDRCPRTQRKARGRGNGGCFCFDIQALNPSSPAIFELNPPQHNPSPPAR
jgi:hypothetical protein